MVFAVENVLVVWGGMTLVFADALRRLDYSHGSRTGNIESSSPHDATIPNSRRVSVRDDDGRRGWGRLAGDRARCAREIGGVSVSNTACGSRSELSKLMMIIIVSLFHLFCGAPGAQPSQTSPWPFCSVFVPLFHGLSAHVV